MSLLFFKHADKSTVNDIFSNSDKYETNVPNVESTILSFDLKSEEKQTKSFYFRDIACKMQFIPEQNPQYYYKDESFYGKSSSSVVKAIFGINSSFLIITAKGNLSKDHAQLIIVNISSALSSLGLNIPYFIQIGKKEDCNYIGRGFDNETKSAILYNSHQTLKNLDIRYLSNCAKQCSEECSFDLTDTIYSSSIYLSTKRGTADISAVFDFPETPFDSKKYLDISDATAAITKMSIASANSVDSPLKKAVHFAASQNTKWPQSPVKSSYARQLLNKCKIIECDRPVKGALPGGILEQLANAMCDETFTILWMSFVSLIKESIAKKTPFAPVKPHKNDSLLQQKMNALNAALTAEKNGQTTFLCPISDDDQQIIDSEIRKLQAALPTFEEKRFRDIVDGIIKYRSTSSNPKFDEYADSFPHVSDDISAMGLLWDVTPVFLTDTEKCIEHVVEWLMKLTPAEVHSHVIIILVSSEIRRIVGEHRTSAFSQKSLSNTLSKATMLSEMASLLQPLDFLKEASDISATIIEGMIGSDILDTVTKLFPGVPKFADEIVRNGTVSVQDEETMKKLCAVFKSKSFLKGYDLKEQTINIVITGNHNDVSFRFSLTSANGKKNIVSVAKAEPI